MIEKDILWHSSAHLLAHAVKELYPKTKLGIGPSIETGFYYDFDFEHKLTPENLNKIEKKMAELAAKNYPITKETLSKKDAVKLFKERGEDYKVELINELPDKEVTVYHQDSFVDLCRGPHVKSTGLMKAFKLTSIAGAYWRGDEKRPMLQRIYGVSFESKAQLDDFLEKLKEAAKRDHRVLGKELDIYSITDEWGAGLPLWHPNGGLLRHVIESYWKDLHLEEGYSLITTPHMAKLDLWETSGHWDFYRENMYSPMEIEGADYEIKPMNCPGHMLIYKSKTRSYRDLPIRWAELGTVYRYERSGVLHGLLRVRGFTQDDAHIFCSTEQLNDEILAILKLAIRILKTFGFNEYDIYLSTRPKKYVGSLDNWERATNALKKALEDLMLDYQEDPGEGVFYGPKIDIKIKDALGRAWQCSTIQVDFNLPERFEIQYMGKDNKEHRPIMIHRAIMGSLERFIGCLIEHYAGAFPLWLSPVQATILPIADRHNDYGLEVEKQLKEAGLRVSSDLRSQSVNKKIRDGQKQKIPYMLIIGDEEVEKKVLSIRDRQGKDIRNVKVDSLKKGILKLVNKKSLDLELNASV
ncbi:MAG: threonine--tRNA ligase [Actinobacteria bacterium]|nr:MAG: threonine--tRNA ligase [Actinomycetota bacterium]